MHPAEYQTLARHEESHWWFVARRRLVNRCIARFGPATRSRPRLLDAGCGTGATLTRHRALTGRAVGLDRSPHALALAAQTHRGRLCRADIARLPLRGDSCHLVTALDVLYHRWVRSDEAALAELYRILKPGGILIVTAPAFGFLTGPHDEVNLTARRYTLPQLRAKLKRAGFTIKADSYTFAMLLPVVFVRRRLQRTFANGRPPASDVKAAPPLLNRALLALFQLELAWLNVARLPWGTSVVLVAQK